MDEVRAVERMNYPIYHLIFRQLLSDLQWQHPQNSYAIPAALPFQIEQTQSKPER